jgi:hypothetical protein
MKYEYQNKTYNWHEEDYWRAKQTQGNQSHYEENKPAQEEINSDKLQKIKFSENLTVPSNQIPEGFSDYC